MVDHGDEEIEEELATVLHLVLHRAAALEGVSCSNDESEVVCAQLRVVVRSVGVGKAGRCEDGRTLNTRLKTLLLERELLQLLEAIAISLAVDDGVLEDGSSRSVDDGLVDTVTTIFKGPAIALLIVL